MIYSSSFYLIVLSFLSIGASCLGQDVYSISKKEEWYGVVDGKGKWIIAPDYKEIQESLPALFSVKNKKGLWGFFEKDKQISECLYDNFRFVSNYQIIVQKQSRWGIISRDGKVLVPFLYRYINPSKGGNFKAGQYNQWTIRTFENKVIDTFAFDSLQYVGDNIYRFCIAGRYGLADQNGAVITTENQDIFVSALQEKYPKKEFSKISDVIPKGNYRIPLEEQYDTVFHFSEGFAKFKVHGKYGFVDSLGNIRLVPQYNQARNFSEGMVAVMLIGKWGFMNVHETLIVQPYYDEVSDFSNGVALVRKEDKYNILDKKGMFLYGDFFDKIIPTYSGNFLLVRNGKVGMADAFGRELISTKYEAVEELGNSFIAAKEHGLWGVLNKKGDIVIPFNYSVIQYDPEHNRMITMEPGVDLILNSKF